MLPPFTTACTVAPAQVVWQTTSSSYPGIAKWRCWMKFHSLHLIPERVNLQQADRPPVPPAPPLPKRPAGRLPHHSWTFCSQKWLGLLVNVPKRVGKAPVSHRGWNGSPWALSMARSQRVFSPNYYRKTCLIKSRSMFWRSVKTGAESRGVSAAFGSCCSSLRQAVQLVVCVLLHVCWVCVSQCVGCGCVRGGAVRSQGAMAPQAQRHGPLKRRAGVDGEGGQMSWKRSGPEPGPRLLLPGDWRQQGGAHTSGEDLRRAG